MKTLILLILFTVITIGVIRSQSECGLETIYETGFSTQANSACSTTENYTPNPNRLNETPIKTIRVNFHFILKDDGTGNWRPNDAGMSCQDTWNTGYRMAKAIVNKANQLLETNIQMQIPLSNGTFPPVLPTRLRLELTAQPGEHPDFTGTYFHYSNQYHTITGSNQCYDNARSCFYDYPESYFVGADSIIRGLTSKV